MDIIFLDGISAETRIGVPEWERQLPQTVLLDIRFGLPHSRSCQSDTIEDTVDYGAVVARVREMLDQASFRLIEALAEQICQLVMDEFGAPWVKVRVTKPGILRGVKTLGVELERGQPEPRRTKQK